MGNPLIDVQQPQIATALQTPAPPMLTNQGSAPANPLAVAAPAVAVAPATTAATAAAPATAASSAPALAAVPPPVTSFGQKLHAALLRSLPALAMSALGKGPGEGLEGALANIAAAPGSGAALVAKTAQNIQAQKEARNTKQAAAQQKLWADEQESERNAQTNFMNHAKGAASYAAADNASEKTQHELFDKQIARTADYAKVHPPLDPDGPLLSGPDINAGIKDGTIDLKKETYLPSGYISMVNPDGSTGEQPGFRLYPVNGTPVPLTDSLLSEFRAYGLDPGVPAGTPLPFSAYSSLTAQLQMRESAQALMDGLKNTDLKNSLENEKLQNNKQYNDDLESVTPYLGAHLSKYSNDPISALQHLSTQIDPATKQKTPQAQAAARLIAGMSPKALETHRHDLALEAAANEKNAIEAANKKTASGQPAGDTNKTGADYLASLPAPERALIQQLHDGNFVLQRWDYPIAKGSAIAQEMALAFPNDKFDSSKASSYSSTYKDFTSGKTAQQVQSGSNAIQHLERLYDLDTMTSRIPGTENSVDFQNTLNTVVPELLKFYGETPTNENIKEMRDKLAPTVNRRDAIANQIGLMSVAYGSLAQKWRNAAPSKSYEQPMPGLNTGAKKVLTRFEPNFVAEYPEFQYNPKAANPTPNPATPAEHITSNAPKGATAIAPAADGSGKMYYVDAQGHVLAPVPAPANPR